METLTPPIATAWRKELLRRIEPLTSRPELIILTVMAALVFGQAAVKHRTDPGSADRASIVIARQIYGADPQAGPRAERQIRAPGYPLILAAIASVDASVARGLSCAGELPEGCTSGFPFLSVVILQTLAAILALFLIYRLAFRLSGSHEVAIITLLLACVWGRFADYAGNLFGHTFYQLGVVASLYLLVPSGTSLSIRRTLVAGAVAGATALIEPTFIVVAAVAALILGLSGLSGRAGSRSLSAAFATGCLGAIVLMLALAYSAGYDPQGIARHMIWGLAERVAFNRLEGATWWAAVLLPIPIFGPIFSLLFPAQIIDSFGYYTPGTLVFDGTTRILPETMAQPGNAWSQLFWLLRTHVLGEPAGYLTSTAALLMRGLWAGGALIALIGVFQVAPMLRWARIGPRYQSTVRIVLLTAALLVAGTLLTSNPIYLHPMLAFVYAYAIAYVAGGR